MNQTQQQEDLIISYPVTNIQTGKTFTEKLNLLLKEPVPHTPVIVKPNTTIELPIPTPVVDPTLPEPIIPVKDDPVPIKPIIPSSDSGSIKPT